MSCSAIPSSCAEVAEPAIERPYQAADVRTLSAMSVAAVGLPLDLEEPAGSVDGRLRMSVSCSPRNRWSSAPRPATAATSADVRPGEQRHATQAERDRQVSFGGDRDQSDVQSRRAAESPRRSCPRSAPARRTGPSLRRMSTSPARSAPCPPRLRRHQADHAQLGELLPEPRHAAGLVRPRGTDGGRRALASPACRGRRRGVVPALGEGEMHRLLPRAGRARVPRPRCADLVRAA